MWRRAVGWAGSLPLVFATRIALACPTCADNLAKDVYGQTPTPLGRGFFWSIILMIALPFALVSGVAIRIAAAKRRRMSQTDRELVPSAETH